MCTCMIREVSLDEIGNIIEKNYKQFIEENWDWISNSLSDLPKNEEVPEDEDYDTYIYFRIQKDTLEVSISSVTGSQYWSGESQSEYWIANYMAFGDTTKKELLEFDCADECHYYDDPECYDSKHITFKGWFIPMENILGAVESPDETQSISFMPRGIFSKTTTEEIPRDCFDTLDEKMGNDILVIRRHQ